MGCEYSKLEGVGGREKQNCVLAFDWGNVMKRDQIEDLRVYLRTILKWILKEIGWETVWTD